MRNTQRKKSVTKKKSKTNKTKSLETTQIKKLLSKKTPEAYIDFTVKNKFSKGEKQRATRIWLDKTGYSIDDINRARNRHPYWKDRKRDPLAGARWVGQVVNELPQPQPPEALGFRKEKPCPMKLVT